jgi:hypothetical protein
MAKYFRELSHNEFYEFFDNLQTQVTANAAAWLIPPLQATALSTAFNTYKPLYNAIKNKQTRTPQQVDDHTTGRNTAEGIIQNFANQYIINNTAISNSTKEALGFTPRTGERHERTAITETPFAGLDAQAGSRIDVTARTQSDASRASMLPMADVVEVRYFVGTAAPATVDECNQTEISTKAKFPISLPPAQAGKKIFAFVRWRNNSEPEKSGPFGDMIVTTVRS